VNIAVQLEPASGTPPEVDYTWDPDTDILSAQLRPKANGDGMSGSVEVEGADGSWLILDVAAGRINGVEVAVWPDVQKRQSLAPPADIEDARVMVPQPERKAPPRGVSSLEVDTAIVAESDSHERVIHFRLGKQRASRTVRVARDLLVEVDPKSYIAGVWLLNVPPFPDE